MTHKGSRALGAVLLAMALATFARTTNLPRLEALHGTDILKLTACGGLFAAGIIGLLGAIRLPRD